MNRTVLFALSDIEVVPSALRAQPAQNIPREETTVSLLRLAHHDFVDEHAYTPDDVATIAAAMRQSVTAGPDLRFRGSGPGTGDRKKGAAERYGRALCRYFLSEFFGIHYFADISELEGLAPANAWNHLTVKRIADGDMPDYFCAKSVQSFFFAEAKGSRSHAMDPQAGYFQTWLGQFGRVALESPSGYRVPTKGYLVGSALCNEQHKKRRGRVVVHDPTTPGGGARRDDELLGAGELAIRVHYARVLDGLGLHPLGDALRLWEPFPDDYRVEIMHTGRDVGGRSFVIGGRPFPWFLDWQPHTRWIYGLDRSTLRWLRDSLSGRAALSQADQVRSILRPSFSLCPDGTLLAGQGYMTGYDAETVSEL
ncbi:MAG: hypothetical protein ABMA64_03325 [Myxococcota bacterium]